MKAPEADAATVIVSNYGIGGSGRYLRELADAMAKSGYPVTFYVPGGTDMGELGGSSCRYHLREPSTHPSYLRAKILKYPFHLLKYFTNTRVIRPGRDTRVVHLLFPFYLTDFMLVNRLKREGKKVVLTVHEVSPHRPFLGGRLDRILIRKMFRGADLLIVHTESLKRKLTHLYPISPEKVRVIRHGYFMGASASAGTSHLRQKYGIPSDRKVLLFFGSIRENKGLDILLRAMQELKSVYFLIIAGDTAGSSELSPEHYRRMIESFGLDGSVHWVRKYISAKEAADIFTIAEAVVLPYRKSFHAQSGVLNLAVGYERPCVVSDVGGIGETVREYHLGVVVKPEDPSALIAGITDLFTEGRGKWGFGRYKRENSWQEMARRLIAEYGESPDL